MLVNNEKKFIIPLIGGGKNEKRIMTEFRNLTIRKACKDLSELEFNHSGRKTL